MRAWTNHVFHLGNRTTNRIEGAHGKLNKYLSYIVGYLATCWEPIHKMLEGQLTDI